MIEITKIPNPLLLDGGLATELEAQGYDLKHSLWSARLLLESPQAIVDAHLAYLRAGAGCIITASYQASVPGFMSLGMSHDEAQNLIALSVQLARKAVDQFCQESSPQERPLIAASVGPYGAYLADGSEYRGDYRVDANTLRDFHQPRMKHLIEANPDLLVCETVPCLTEAQVLSDLILEFAAPAWISFSCRDGQHLSSGEEISEAASVLEGNPYLFALGVNCTSPAHINPLIVALQKHWPKRIVVYPNSGEHYDVSSGNWHGTADPGSCATAATTWQHTGADIIGGCCRMGPSHIKAMGNALQTSI
ncbi:MAG: homocysteine S-methyltransferase [Halioglobus sp.]